MRMRVPKSSVLALVGSLVAITAAGCGDDESGGSLSSPSGGNAAAAENLKVSAQLFGRAIPFFAGIAKGMQAGADENGFDFKVSWSDLNPQEQLDQVQTLMTEQPKGIFFAPLDPKTVEPALLQAEQNGTRVVTISGALLNPDAYTTAVGANFAEMGAKKAEAIVEQLGGEGKVALVHGQRGLPFVEDQTKAAKKVFEANPGIEIVSELFNKEVTVDQGLNATQNVLTSNPDVQAIFFDGDDLAVGGIQAITERGIDHDDIFVVGTDGLDPGVKAVQDGNLDYTLAECPFRIGMIADETMRKAIDGEELPEYVYTPVIELTPDKIDGILASDEWAECTGE